MRIRNMRRPRRPAEGRIRRDPRAERFYLGQGPELVTTSPSGRPRVNPHALRMAGPHPVSGRLRIDRSRPLTAAPVMGTAPVEPGTAAATAPKLKQIIIDEPACWVVAVPNLEDGRLTSHDRDMLGGARVLADANKGAVVVLAFGANDDLGAAGADRVIYFNGPEFESYSPEARAAAVVAVIKSLSPQNILFSDTLTGGGDIGRRVAAVLGEQPAVQVQKLTKDQVICRGNGGKSDFVMAPPKLILMAPEAADPVMGVLHEARPEPAPEVQVEPTIIDRGPMAVDPNSIPLPESDFIVSAGNGVTDWDAFHKAAGALGGTEGGSRVVCDAGFLPRERQVGASGFLVEPRAYVAFGIAGAPQHLQGITRCERVVAINTDLHAEMVKRADLAVIADAQKVMPALTKLMEEKRRAH